MDSLKFEIGNYTLFYIFHLFLLFSASLSFAGVSGLVDNSDFKGYVRGEAHIPSRAKNQPETALALTTEINGRTFFNDNFSAAVNLRGRFYDLSRSVSRKLDLREGFLQFSGDWLDLTIGQQIIAWGQADGINPTNNLCPMDHKIFSTEPDDRRRGAPALKADFYAGNFTLTGIWQVYRESKILGPFIRESLTIQTQDPWLPVVDYPTDQIFFMSPELPDKNIRDSSLAFKCSVNLRRLDFSLSYFHGYSLYPDYMYDKTLIETYDENWEPVHGWEWDRAYEISKKYDRLNVFGADFAYAFDPFIIRGEAAWIRTGFDKKKNPAWRQSFLHYVIGLEWQCTENLVLSSQYSMKYIPGFKTVEELFGSTGDFADMFDERLPAREVTRFNRRSHGLQRRHNEQMTFKLGWYFFQRTLLIELKGAYIFKQDEYKIKPKIAYDINDNLEMAVAANMFFGPDESQFDMKGKTYNQVLVELKYGF